MLFVGRKQHLNPEDFIVQTNVSPSSSYSTNVHPLLRNTILVENLEFFNTETTSTSSRALKKRKRIEEEEEEEEKEGEELRIDYCIVHPLAIDKYLFEASNISSLFSVFKTQLLPIHIVSPVSLSLDSLLPFISPSPPGSSPHLLSLYTTLAISAQSVHQHSAARSFILLALETLRSLPFIPSLTLSASVLSIQYFFWVQGVGSDPVIQEYFRPDGLGSDLFVMFKETTDKNDTNSYIATKQQVLDMMNGTGEDEERLRAVLKILEQGMTFDEGFDEDTRKELVLFCFLLAHTIHIFGVMSSIKRQTQTISCGYLFTLCGRLSRLEQLNESSMGKKHLYQRMSNSQNLAKCDMEGGSYWNVKLLIRAMKYLVLRRYEDSSEMKNMAGSQKNKYADEFLDDFEKMLTDLLGLMTPMVMEALIEDQEWERSDRMLSRLKEMREIRRMVILDVMIEKYQEELERKKEQQKQEEKFEEVFSEVDANKGVFTTNTWKIRKETKRTKNRKEYF